MQAHKITYVPNATVCVGAHLWYGQALKFKLQFLFSLFKWYYYTRGPTIQELRIYTCRDTYLNEHRTQMRLRILYKESLCGE